MSVFVVKRYVGETGSDPKHHLSLVSYDDDWPVMASADLPFDTDEVVSGGSCGELVFFMGERGKIIVCNLMTRRWRVFPLPEYLPDASTVALGACGLGYDPVSRDYKLYRDYNLHYRDGDDRYLRSEHYTELYSFTSGSWNKIRTPDASIIYPCAVYFDGICYWTAVLELNFGGLAYDNFRHQILTFHIASEEFGYLSFPPSNIDYRSARSKVIVYGRLLGALIYGGPDYTDWTIPLHVNLFVHRDGMWQLLFDISFDGIERPLGIGESRDGFMLFLEMNKNCGEASGRTRWETTSELMAYNFESKELKRLGIHDRRSHMITICFDLKTYRIPGLTPMHFVDNIVPLSEDVREMKSEINPLSKSRPRKKMKSGESKDIEEV